MPGNRVAPVLAGVVSAGLARTHQEDLYEDTERIGLLEQRLRALGRPPVAAAPR